MYCALIILNIIFAFKLALYPTKIDYYQKMVSFVDIIFTVLFHPASKMTLQKRHYKPKIKTKRRSWKWKFRPIHAFTILSMSTTTRYHTNLRVDTDSESIGIDNRATACISHRIDDFIGPLVDTDRVIVGYNGSRTTNIKKGTIRWKWSDDNGVSHIYTPFLTHFTPLMVVYDYLAPNTGLKPSAKMPKLKAPHHV